MIAKKVTINFLTSFSIYGLGYISLIFVARYMGAEALGIIAFVNSYIGLYLPIGDLGFSWAHLKRISEGKDLGRCNGTYFSVKLFLMILMSIIIFVSVQMAKAGNNGIFISQTHETVLYILLLTTFIANFGQAITHTFQARQEVVKQNIPLVSQKIILVSGKVIVALTGIGVIYLAYSGLLSAIIGILIIIWLFKKYPVKKPSWEYFKSYFKYAIPVMFIGILPTIAQNIDKVMIQFFYSSTQVGEYSASQSLSFIFNFIGIAGISLLFTSFSEFSSKGEISKIRDLAKKAEKYLSMILFPLAAFTIVFAEEISLHVLGGEFNSTAPILTIMVIMWVVHAIGQPYTQQVTGSGKLKSAAKITSLTFIINILLNFIFIPEKLAGIKMLGLGPIGAAYASLISVLVGSIFFRISAYRITGSRFNPGVFIYVFSALVSGGVLIYLYNTITFYRWYMLIPYFGLQILIYFGLLVLIRGFSSSDMKFFLNLFNPNALKEYIVDEMKSEYTPDK